MDSTPIYQVNFASFNIFMAEIPKDMLDNLLKKADEIKSSWAPKNKGNDLAGHMQHQHALDDVEELKDFVLKLSTKYYNHLNDSGGLQISYASTPELINGDPWINFQAPTEFNPLHNHSGLYSWVLWLRIPYDRKAEDNYFPERPGTLSGTFNFVYPGSFSGIGTHTFYLDKEYEGRLVLFPSTLQHEVYPFYTTNEYRVSIAGNVFVNNGI